MENFLVILAPVLSATLLGVVGWLCFWRSWDSYRKEPYSLLIMAMGWGILFTLGLKWFLAEANIVNPSLGLVIVSLFLEEFVKAFALINALEVAKRKFDELNDGIIYGAAAALGFVLVETVFYLQTATDFWSIFWGRLIYTAPAHMLFTGIFGMYYARAYLSDTLVQHEHKRKQQPLAIIGNILEISMERLPEKKQTFCRLHCAVVKEIWRLLTLYITRKHIIFGHRVEEAWSSEIVIEGFLLAFYLHVGYDLILQIENTGLRAGGLILALLAFGALLMRFVQLEKRERKALGKDK